MSTLEIKHLLGLRGVSANDIRIILDNAAEFRKVLERKVKNLPTLRGTTIVNLFFESSTRTRISFELAEKRLSADIVNFATSGSSVQKGETLLDTLKNIGAQRHWCSKIFIGTHQCRYCKCRRRSARTPNASPAGYFHN